MKCTHIIHNQRAENHIWTIGYARLKLPAVQKKQRRETAAIGNLDLTIKTLHRTIPCAALTDK